MESLSTSRVHTIAYVAELDTLEAQPGDLAVSFDGVAYYRDNITWTPISGAGAEDSEPAPWACAWCDRPHNTETECPGCGAPQGSRP